MYRLFHSAGTAGLAPHIVLEELGTPYEWVRVDREHNEHRGPAYLKMNPAGTLPTLMIGDAVVTESAAICLHLADCHPVAGLIPALATSQRAQCYRWLMYLTNTLQAELMVYFYPERLGGEAADEAKAVQQRAEARIGSMLDLIEQHLEKRGGTWLCGESFSVADIYLLMLGRWTRGFGHPARNRKMLGALMRRVLERPATIRAFQQEQLAEPWI